MVLICPHFSKSRKTSLANLVTHQAQRHSLSLVCFVRMYALALVRKDVHSYLRTYRRTPPSKLMTTCDRWAWWVNKQILMCKMVLDSEDNNCGWTIMMCIIDNLLACWSTRHVRPSKLLMIRWKIIAGWDLGIVRVIIDYPLFDPRGRPQSRPIVITIFTRGLCPYVPTFQNLADQNKFQVRIVSSNRIQWYIYNYCLLNSLMY